jgi:hypothetical protein
MAIRKYEFPELTSIIYTQFPPAKCNEFYCKFSTGFGSLFNLTAGVASGNNLALKRLRNIGRGKIEDEEMDFSTPSKFMYYNNDKREY